MDNALFNIAGRVGINPTSIKLDLAKMFFDLGEDLHAIRMLMSYGYNNLNNDDILSYMISNGLDVMPQNGMEALRGSSIFMDMWKSPRLSRLMILSNYQVPGYVLSNLVIEGKSLEEKTKEKQESFQELSIEEHMKQYLDQGLSEKDAMKAVAKDRGVSKRDIYQVLHVENR